MSTTVFYPKLNISQLRLGDIVEMENNTMKYGVMTVTEVTTRSLAKTYNQDTDSFEYREVPYITMERPHIEVYGKGDISRHTEKIEAFADHSGLNYSVYREVQLFQDQIIQYRDGDWRVLEVMPNGQVKLQAIWSDGNKESQLDFIEVPEMELTWDYISDWKNPNLKFYDRKNRKIVPYSELYK